MNAGGRRQYLLCALCGARLQPQRWSKCDNEEMPQVLVFVLLAHCNQNARKGIFEAFRSISKLLKVLFLLSKFWRLESLELSWDHQTSSQERHPWDLRLKEIQSFSIPAIPAIPAVWKASVASCASTITGLAGGSITNLVNPQGFPRELQPVAVVPCNKGTAASFWSFAY